jgi:hypothetical protein
VKRLEAAYCMPLLDTSGRGGWMIARDKRRQER